MELTSTDVNDTVPLPTGGDGMYHQYRVTITPHHRVDTVKISIKEFHNRASSFESDTREQLRPAVATTTPPGTGVMVSLPQSEGGAQTKVAETTEAAATVATEKGTVDVNTTVTEAAKVEFPDTSVMIPEESRIYISEIMFARGVHGTLPQWIEISNGSRTEEVNLSGWTLTVENTTADTDVSPSVRKPCSGSQREPELVRVVSTIHLQPFSLSPIADVTILTVRWQTVRSSTSGWNSKWR